MAEAGLLRDADSVLPWLYAVPARTVANHRRSLRRHLNLLDRARFLAAGSEPSPEVQVVRLSEDAAVIEAVEQLPPQDREVILLSAWEGLSGPQIAARFGISVAAAEKRLSRSKHRLAGELTRAEKKHGMNPRPPFQSPSRGIECNPAASHHWWDYGCDLTWGTAAAGTLGLGTSDRSFRVVDGVIADVGTRAARDPAGRG